MLLSAVSKIFESPDELELSVQLVDRATAAKSKRDKARAAASQDAEEFAPCRAGCGMSWAGWAAAGLPDETAKWGAGVSEEVKASRRCQLKDFKWAACEGCPDAWWCPQCNISCVRHERTCAKKAAKDAAAGQRKRARDEEAAGLPEVPGAKKPRRKRKQFV